VPDTNEKAASFYRDSFANVKFKWHANIPFSNLIQVKDDMYTSQYE